MRTSATLLSSVALALGIAAAATNARGALEDKSASAASGERKISYLRDVRPILAHYCFACHGPDEATREEDLRLDLREHAFEARGSRAVIAPGAPEKSLVWLRMSSDSDSKRMPPPEQAKQPSALELATIKTWIEQGAEWEEHWAFVPPRRAPAPQVSDPAWLRDPLDAFVLEQLDRAHLKPSPEASREAWLRRASFDLTGLPPTPTELDAFLGDSRPDAYEREADRLLASPRYGERMTQEWLDLARYSDTSGYQNDTPRSIWKWREWVIEAFNANMPYDRFTIEQLAGDLLPNATLAQKVATGFNRNHPTNSEAGEEEDEYRSAYVIDRVNTTATAFMGLTLACTQCHDHKYDALSQRDYYAFYSFFNNVKERDSDWGNPKPSISVPNPDQTPRLEDLKKRIDAVKARLEQDEPLADAAQREWEARTRAKLGADIEWTTLAPAGMLARNGSRLERLDDGSILSSGPAPVKDTYDLVLQPGKRRIGALRIEVLPDPSLPEQGLGRASDGRFILSALELRNSTLSDSSEPPLVYLSTAQADLNQKPKKEPTGYDMTPGSIESSIVVEPLGAGGKEVRWGGRGWSIVDDERKLPHEAVLLPLEPLETNEASVLRLSLHHTSNAKFKSLIGRLRISVTDDERLRTQLMSVQGKLWSSIGPFPAESAAAAFEQVFAPEKDVVRGALDLKKTYDKVELAAPNKTDAAPKESGAATTAAPVAAAPAKPNSRDAKPEPAVGPSAPAAVSPVPTPAAALEVAKKDEKAPASEAAKSKKAPPEKLEWNEQRLWRDAAPAKLEGANAAFYVTRKLESTQARTAMLEIDGPAGLRLWLNGELVQTFAPAASANPDVNAKKGAAESKPDAKPTAKPEEKSDDDEEESGDGGEEEEFDFSAMFDEPRSKTARRFRIGLRQGTNELVLKLVFAGEAKGGGRGESGGEGGGDGSGGARRGGGGSFSFRITPEGEDVLTYEVVEALRRESEAPAAPLVAQDPLLPVAAPSPAPSAAPSTAPNSSPSVTGSSKGGPDAGRVVEPPASNAPALAVQPSKSAEEPQPKKVSLVGEVSAPLKSGEEVNPLTPSERRRKLLREHYRTTIDPIGRVLAEELARLEAEEREVKKQVPQTLVMEELDKPRQAYIFTRGLYKNRGENVDPGTPAVLPPMDPQAPRNRLGLAQWLVSGRHPLTARVLTNRIWQQYFGVGLVRSAEDFGVRADAPSHPELLDLLALEFVESGWDLKKLHRRIVLSATYRQDSAASAASLETDPENRLLSRAPRLRLSAEMVRDNALAVSGLLLEKLGGPSVKPRQPKNAWKTVEGNRSSNYVRHRDERQYRRGVYVYSKRGAPYPSMLTFDAAKRDSCAVTRATTNTPVQALTLLNDPVYVECAKMLAQRLLTERHALGRARDPKPAEQDALRLSYGFRLCTSRSPNAQELELLVKLLGEQREHFKASSESAKELLQVGDAKLAPEIDVLEAAAWTGVASALLNLDATLHRG